MGTTIDSLQIEIQSNSTNAAGGIDALAKALKKLNKNGEVSNAVTNLNDLRKSLHAFVNMPSNASKIESLAKSLKSLSKVGPIDLGTSLGSVKKAMESLGTINVEGVAPQIQRIAEALTPLNKVKGSGFNAMMNGLKKLDEVVDGLDSAAIDRFVAKIKELDEKVGPVSQKLVAIGNAFKGVNSKATQVSGGFSVFGGKVNTTTLNLQSMISVAKNLWSTLQPIVNLLKKTIGDAIEWEGIAQRFGRGFGEQADEVYSWIQELNKEMGINVQQFMQYSSTYATMLKGFGVASEDASKMALGYMELTYDVWAGYNDIYKSLDDAATAVRSAIAGEVEPVRKAGFTIIESTLEQTAANHGLEISLEKATEAQKSYLRYLTLVDQAKAQGLVGNYAREMNTAEGVMRTFNQQLKSLGQTFGSIFLPVLVKVMPWLQAFVDLVGDAIIAVSNFFGVDIQKVDFGGSISGSADSATESVNGTTAALKELKNATTGIDELNVISPQSSSGSGGSGSSAGFEGLDVGSLWDKSIFDSIQFEVDAIKEQLKEALSGIEAVVSGFALAIGAILVFSANPKTVALGIGLLAVGAVGLAHSIAANWDGMSEQLAETLTIVTSTVGGFLLALGAMFAFTGVNVGLGIGLMVAGATSLGTAVAINWKFLEGDFKNTLSILTAIVSGGALALGAVLAFSGAKVGLGIALMVAGAAGLVTAMALNWDSLSEPTRKAIGTIGAIAGGSLLAIGLIMCLTGGALPIGIGLMAAGAASIVSAVALNWGSLTGETENSVATITAIASGALLGIGAVLAFSGAATPLGIALLAAGAIGLASAVTTLNWDTVKTKLQGPVGKVVALVSGSLLAVGAILAFSGVGLVLGISLMAAGAAGLATTTSANWGTIKTKLQGPVGKVVALVSGALIAVGAILAFSGVGLGLGIGLMAAGAAGLATTVALNWDSIVNSIKKVLKKIGIAAGAAMLALGVILCLTGVGIPLGIGLIAAGAASLVAGIALNWDSIKASIQKVINKIKDWVSKYGLLVLGVILCLTGAGIPLGIALIKKGLETKTENGSTVGDDLLKTLKEKWNAVKEWWNSKPALKKISTTIEDIKTKVSTAWTNAKTWWSGKSRLEKAEVSVSLIKKGWNNIKEWLGNLDFKLNFKLPKIGVNWGEKTVLGFKISYPSGFYTYAKGGFPDMGEMFIAREAGPEMVGRIGSKTTVANNDQIVEGISEGVYAAVLAAMKASEANGSQAVNVYLDGRQITSAVERRQKERGAGLMGNQVYSY